MPLTYAQTQAVLAFVTGITPGSSPAFESRLKQWQKKGFPEGVNVGRGARAAYGATQVFQLLFMLKLLHVGLTPERAQRVVLTGWASFKDAIAEATDCLAMGADHQHYCLIQLDALSDLKGDDDHMHIFVELFTGDEIASAFLEELEDDASKADKNAHSYFRFWVKNRMAIAVTIEIDSMLVMLWTMLEAVGAPSDVFADEIAQWYEERIQRGRAAQSDKDYFDPSGAPGSIPKGSLVHRVRDFDVRAAAKANLSKVVDHDSDTQT